MVVFSTCSLVFIFVFGFVVFFHFSFYLVTRLVGEWVPWVANYECDTLSCSAGGYTGWGWEKREQEGETVMAWRECAGRRKSIDWCC